MKGQYGRVGSVVASSGNVPTSRSLGNAGWSGTTRRVGVAAGDRRSDVSSRIERIREAGDVASPGSSNWCKK